MELELVFQWIVKSSLMASILAIAILLIRYALRNKLGAKWQYAIWLLLIIRLLIPYDIQSPWSIYSLLPPNSLLIPVVKQVNVRLADNETQMSNMSGNEGQITSNQAVPNIQSAFKADLTNVDINILAVIWLSGGLVLAALIIAANFRFYLKIKREASVTEARMSELMQECTFKRGIRKTLSIIITNQIETPCLYGVLSPKLLMPLSLINRLNDDTIRHIFSHELSHYLRKDIPINWLAVAAQILHWFNPLIWYSLAKMRDDCELACDADTLSYLKPEEHQSYGLSIISLVTPAQSSWLPGTTGFLGNRNNQIRRRIKMIKFFRKSTGKWTCLAAVIIISLGLLGFTNSIASVKSVSGVAAPQQTTQTEQYSAVPKGSFDYPAYLSFTPLLPSYMAGYPLNYSQIACTQDSPWGHDSNTYFVAYGSHAAFTISESRPTSERELSGLGQVTKTQIQIGGLPATLYERKIGDAHILFTKNNVEYIASNVLDGGVSLDELKKICESIAVPVNSPPTDIHIEKGGASASEGLSFKTLKPSDLFIPQRYKFRDASSHVYIKGNDKSEAYSLYFATGSSTPFINVTISKGNQPYGDPNPVLTPKADFETKQIDGTDVKLRKNYNDNLPAAKFTIPETGLDCTLYSTEQESTVEKMAESVLQAYTKL